MKAIHNKTGKVYKRFGYCINKTTGIDDGKRMILYRGETGQLFCREEKI